MTEAQKALWGLLVDQHLAHSGAQFLLVRSSSGAALSYNGAISVSCPYEDADFLKLNQEGFLVLSRDEAGLLFGAPTQLGIDAILGARLVSASDDPWKSNPFPPETLEYKSWATTMLWAKERTALFHAEILEKLPPEEAPAKTFLDRRLEMVAGTFDIWAEGFSKSMTSTDNAAEGFGRLLIALEKLLLTRAIATPLSSFPRSAYESEIKIRLCQRRQHWLGHALRSVREHKDAESSKAEINHNVEPSADAKPVPVEPGDLGNLKPEGISDISIFLGSIPSRRRVGSPIIYSELFFPMTRHLIIADTSSLQHPTYPVLYKEIVGIANRIQAAENPELPAAEAGDRWLDRLSITPRPLWTFKDVLTRSAEFCADFATHLVRSGKPELAAVFDSFAARFKALLAEYPSAPNSPSDAEASTDKPISVDVGTEPRNETSPHTNVSAEATEKSGSQARTWEDVEISFLSDDRVQIKIGKETETRNYAEFGFEDGRTGAPNRAWATLRYLAESEGHIHRAADGDWPALEKRMQEIRSRFRSHFDLDGDPLPFEKGYRARFKISCGPAYNS